MSGRLIGIARRPARLAPMEERDSGSISIERGLKGDHKGAKFPRRQITILALEDWLAANAQLNDLPEAKPLAWTVRRANLLVEGVRLPRAKGGIVAIGDVELEITAQTVPCRRMDDAQQGLAKALWPDWRGGVSCRVLSAGEIVLGDRVKILHAPQEHKIRLPG